MFGLNIYAVIGAVIAFCVYTGVVYTKGRSDMRANWEAAEAKIQKAVDDKVKAAYEAKGTVERTLGADKDKLEKQHADDQKYIDGLRLANGRFLAATGGLFDRNGRPVSGSAAGQNPGAAAGNPSGPAGCQLSEQTSSDLFDLARDCDVAASFARTCSAWIDTITPICNAP